SVDLVERVARDLHKQATVRGVLDEAAPVQDFLFGFLDVAPAEALLAPETLEHLRAEIVAPEHPADEVAALLAEAVPLLGLDVAREASRGHVRMALGMID